MEDKKYHFSNATVFKSGVDGRDGELTVSWNCDINCLPRENRIMYIKIGEMIEGKIRNNTSIAINEKDMYELKDYMVAICAEYDRIKEEVDKKSRRAELIKQANELRKQLNDVSGELWKLTGENVVF